MLPRKVLHTIGDSHSDGGHSHWGRIQIENLDVVTHHVGPILAHSVGLGRIDAAIQERVSGVLGERLKFNHNDMLVFCFGEIDCRCHVHRQISPVKTYQQVIDELTESYVSKIIELTNGIGLSKVFIYNATPTIRTTNGDGDFPFLGTREERKSYHLYMNKKLREHCNASGLIFFDIYDHIIDSEGYLNVSQSDGSIHVVDPIPAQNFLYNIL